ncbi:MAG TPA: transposase [Burkholderiaceae bacterium]|nr:transposase [Burkholderiaceae bacterium]
MGERKLAMRMAVKPVTAASQEAIDTTLGAADDAMRVQTPGGVYSVRWDERCRATALGQLVFFAEYLETSGLFEAWRKSCPLSYTSPNAPALVDVLGTWMLSILDGHCRYAHVGALRGDGVAPSVLGMNKIIGDDSLRRALSAIAPAPDDKHTPEQRAAQQAQLASSTQWMQAQLKHSIAQATATPWILDCDTTIKVLYGKQDGAVVSYNPHKPGRPSHAIHTYWIGNLRLVLDAQLDSGNRHSPVHARPGLMALLEDMSPASRPKLVRGDCVFGSEGEMSALEAIGQPYLFKLRQSPGVKALIKRQWTRRDWASVGQGWQACEDVLRLTGWTQSRRVIVMRRVRKLDLIVELQGELKHRGRGKGKDAAQAELHFIDENEPVKSWEYAVLVCNAHYELQNIGQLYRDRADCENGFDEIKNQWGWGGYSTHDIERCALSARAVALVYNWWSWYVRLAHPKTRLEAITSRPKLLSAVGRLSIHGGQKKVLLSVTHEAAAQIKRLIVNVRAGLSHVRATAPQLDKSQCWFALVRYIVERILTCQPKPNPGLIALASG